MRFCIALGALVALAIAGNALPAGGAGAVARESAKAGVTLGPLAPTGRDHNVEGYASEVSVYPGQLLHLHVSTRPAARYQIQFLRLGWYRGKGGRLLACIPRCSTRSLNGSPQSIPTPDAGTGMVRLRWPVTSTFRIPRDWVTGYYIAKLVHSAGSATIPFFVRQPLSQPPSRILIISSIATEEAYNPWGGKSLYTFNSTNKVAATHVSFDRPFTGFGSGYYDLGLIHFLETLPQLDISYASDVEVDRDPAELLRHRLVIVVGHNEYWSQRMRDAYENARDHGVNLAFFGGDYGDWQIRYEDAGRTIVEYRDSTLDPNPNPTDKTVNFSRLSPPRPQCQILGTQFGYGPAMPQPTRFRINPAAISDPWFNGTGFKADTVFTAKGDEADAAAPPGCLPYTVTTFFTSADNPSFAPAVRYQASSGATVFAAGSYALSASTGDRRIARFINNLVTSMSR
jgi:hypothetical protein